MNADAVAKSDAKSLTDPNGPNPEADAFAVPSALAFFKKRRQYSRRSRVIVYRSRRKCSRCQQKRKCTRCRRRRCRRCRRRYLKNFFGINVFYEFQIH